MMPPNLFQLRREGFFLLRHVNQEIPQKMHFSALLESTRKTLTNGGIRLLSASETARNGGFRP
jgi:hypothetical protein